MTAEHDVARATDETVDLCFPASCAFVGADRIVLRISRDNLPGLREYIAALELRLTEAPVRGRGVG